MSRSQSQSRNPTPAPSEARSTSPTLSERFRTRFPEGIPRDTQGRTTRSQSARGAPLMEARDHPERPIIEEPTTVRTLSQSTTSNEPPEEISMTPITRMGQAILQRIEDLTAAWDQPIPQADDTDQTIMIGDTNHNQTNATEADIINGTSRPRQPATIEEVEDVEQPNRVITHIPTTNTYGPISRRAIEQERLRELDAAPRIFTITNSQRTSQRTNERERRRRILDQEIQDQRRQITDRLQDPIHDPVPAYDEGNSRTEYTWRRHPLTNTRVRRPRTPQPNNKNRIYAIEAAPEPDPEDSSSSSSSSSTDSWRSSVVRRVLDNDPDLQALRMVLESNERRIQDRMQRLYEDANRQNQEQMATLIQNVANLNQTWQAWDPVLRGIARWTESAALNAQAAQQGQEEVLRAQNTLLQRHQGQDEQIQTLIKALGTMGKEVAATLENQRENMEILQETIQGIDTNISEVRSIKEPEQRWDPPDESTRREQPRESRSEVPKGARAKKPEAFSGRRGRDAEVFLMKMEIYFRDYGTHFTDEQKITNFLTNMGEGEASKWAAPLMKTILSGEDHIYTTTWQTLKDAFLLSFSDPLKREKAIRDISKLVQGGSAQQYVSSFRTMAQELNWDDNALIDQFKKGLKTHVQQELLKIGISQDTQGWSLEKWMESAIKIDDVLFMGRSLGNPTAQSTPQGNWRQKQESKPLNGKAGRVSQDVLKKRKDKNLCLKCGRIGHRVKDCRDQEWYTGDRYPNGIPTNGKQGTIEEVKGTSDTESEN